MTSVHLGLIPDRTYSEMSLFAEVRPAQELDLEQLNQRGILRRAYRSTYGFTVATTEVLDKLAELIGPERVLEVGAGTGYLSHALAKRGVRVTASDAYPENNRYGFKRIWQNNHVGDSVELLPGNFDYVLMAWPPLDRPFATQVAQRMCKGQVLLFNGEYRGGCTADESFYDEIASQSNWEYREGDSEALNQYHLQLSGMHDHWQVFQKLV